MDWRVTLENQMRDIGQRAKSAAQSIQAASADQRTKALHAIARRVREATTAILAANATDVAAARANARAQAARP